MTLSHRFLCVLTIFFSCSCCCLATKLKSKKRHSVASTDVTGNHGVAEIPLQPGFSDLLSPEQLLAPSSAEKKPKNAAKMNLMEQSVMMLAEQQPAVADDSANITEFVELMKEALDNMSRDLWHSIDGADQACLAAKSNFSGCPEYSADTTFGPPDFDGNWDPLRSAHANCRTELIQLKYKYDRCETAASSSFTLEEVAINHFESLNIFESPQECATSHTDPEAYITAMIQHFQSKETAWWQAYHNMQNISNNASQWNCEQIKLDYFSKAANCSAYQLAFENTACDVWDRTNSSCTNIGACFDERWHAYQMAVNSTNASLEDLALEWRGIQRMYCLVNAFAAADVNAAIDVCINKRYSIDFVMSNSTCVNNYNASAKPVPVVPSICSAVVCASHITISGAEAYQNDMMGTYQRTDLAPTSFNGFKPIYESSNGHHLYFISSHNVWMIGYNGDTDNLVGGIYGYGGDVTCPETVSYWISYTSAGWKYIQSMSFAVSTEDPSWVLYSGIAVKYPGRHMFREAEYTHNNIDAGPCLASCCDEDPYTWILHQNVTGTQFYCPPGETGEYPSVWQAQQACEAATELNCLGVYQLACSASITNPAKLILAGSALTESHLGSCVEEMYLGNATTVSTTLPPQLCTYEVNVSRSDTDYHAVWRSYQITGQGFDEQFVFVTCTTEGAEGQNCTGQGVQNGVRVLTNRDGVGVQFGSCCFNVTNQVLTTELVACNGYFNDYTRIDGRFALESRLSVSSYGTASDARDRCLRLGPMCWGIMDDGCDGSNFKVIESSKFNPDSDLLVSTQGTCVYQKRVDPNFDSFPTSQT